MAFLDEHYLLTTPTSRELFAEIRDLPILDPHNHASAREIVENRPWSDLWEVEGATDHYVWELMRRRGIPEEKITGTASNHDKWLALARVFPEFIGNPTYEWVHLDLRRRLGIFDEICAETAEDIWCKSLEKLAGDDLRPQAVLESMQVETLCTTDDPTLRLPYHETAAEAVRYTAVLPTWRPDKAMDPTQPAWRSFVEGLAEETGETPEALGGLEAALAKTHAYFRRLGAVASDHGFSTIWTGPVARTRAEEIYRRAWEGESLSLLDRRDFQAYLLRLFGEWNRDAGLVMQLHVGAVRDYRHKLWKELGPDSGGDISTQQVDFAEGLRWFLNEFDGTLKIVLYCLDPTHLPTVATIARAFPNVFVGAAWWFNDSPLGMEQQLKYLATVDLLYNHAGMVTDSRKILSFGSRTEMFRRVLCRVLGEMVEAGQVPLRRAMELARRLAYDRPYELFFA
ncbi:MAG: glucuronate isomerase [Acidobacteriota bacterium]